MGGELLVPVVMMCFMMDRESNRCSLAPLGGQSCDSRAVSSPAASVTTSGYPGQIWWPMGTGRQTYICRLRGVTLHASAPVSQSDVDYSTYAF